MTGHWTLPTRKHPGFSSQRRHLLQAALTATVMGMSAGVRAAGRSVLFPDYPFKLGVASGSPASDGFVLWTRLCPDPLHDGGMGVMQVPLRWEVAKDEHFGDVVQSGQWYAMAGLGHSAHVPVTGLAPDRWYWYRFVAGNEVSPVGRTRTLPAPTAPVDRLRFALASCQNFELGYFSAYRHMKRAAPDFVCFVGDYIYEYNSSAPRVRIHAQPEPYSLQGYRARYAQYRLDPDLQAMHQTAPWLYTLDDHEVMNDWGGDQSEDLDPAFPERRGNALQAWFEHQPLPLHALLANRRVQVYRGLRIGQLAHVHILDNRQHRDPMVCPRPGMAGSRFDATDATCPQRIQVSRSLLGQAQEAWLDRALSEDRSTWNVLMQSSALSPLPTPGPQGPEFYTDSWDGYPGARQRLLTSLKRHRVRNPLILGGDLHCTIASDIKADYDRPDSVTVGTEFVGTSMTSPSMAQATLDLKVAANPHVHFGDSTHRGYLLFDMSTTGVEVTACSSQDVMRRESACVPTARFHVQADRPGIQKG